MTFALDRQTAEGFYDALVSRDPVRIDPFLDDDVDWLIVGPIELFAFYGQHYGRQSVLDAYRQLSRIEEASASACEFLLVDGDCASALGEAEQTLGRPLDVTFVG